MPLTTKRAVPMGGGCFDRLGDSEGMTAETTRGKEAGRGWDDLNGIDSMAHRKTAAHQNRQPPINGMMTSSDSEQETTGRGRAKGDLQEQQQQQQQQQL